MAEEKFTRCPGCNTIFRVTPPQLALRAGQVRCGHCRTVFDGILTMTASDKLSFALNGDYGWYEHGAPGGSAAMCSPHRAGSYPGRLAS